MYIIKYTKNPAKTLWIGWTEYNNGIYFNSGHTLDELVRHTKNALWAKGVSGRQIYLDTKPSDITLVPKEKMSSIFMGKYWNKGLSRITPMSMKPIAKIPAFVSPVNDELAQAVAPVVQESQKYDYYEYKVRDGKLVLYGIIRREIDQFELRKNGAENVEQ